MRRASLRLSAAKFVEVPSRYPLLFTAGPLQTTASVKAAMLKDYGSRDAAFIQCIKEVRQGIVRVGQCDPQQWSAVPMQGSGTMGVEAVVRTTVPKSDALLAVLANGAYGYRIAAIAERIGVPAVAFEQPEGQPIDLNAFASFVAQHAARLTNFAVVHCETSTGMFNPVREMHDIVRRAAPRATIILDAMSSFGGVELDVDSACDIMVSSSNKCIQGVPGFSVVLARRQLLQRCRGWSNSFTLDVAAQNEALDKSEQFPHTPPVQALVAFRQALAEHAAEGGTPARSARYRALAMRIREGMKALGFTTFLDETGSHMGHIITAFNTPAHPRWNFTSFNDRLREKGVVLYPGKASRADTFRIGSLGDLHPDDVEFMLKAVGSTLEELDISLLKDAPRP